MTAVSAGSNDFCANARLGSIGVEANTVIKMALQSSPLELNFSLQISCTQPSRLKDSALEAETASWNLLPLRVHPCSRYVELYWLGIIGTSSCDLSPIDTPNSSSRVSRSCETPLTW